MSNLEVSSGAYTSEAKKQGEAAASLSGVDKRLSSSGRSPQSNNGEHRVPAVRCQSVFLRSTDEVNAMSKDKRFRLQVKNFFKRICCSYKAFGDNGQFDVTLRRRVSFGSNNQQKQQQQHGGEGGGSSEEDEEGEGRGPSPQYRLEATNYGHSLGFFGRITSCCWGSAGGSGTSGIGIHYNQRLASSLHWMFRVNFMFLFMVMCAIFFVWVIIFAGLIIAAGRIDNECVRVGGEPFANTTSEFADAFGLSWTTFSTVGYGSTYPALGHESSNPTNCLFITFICSLESFLGVLYSGFCGAILFGKVLRIQSHAQVVFSDPIVIRYGSGVQEPPDGNDTDDEESHGKKKIPCPVLEFRVVNRLFGETGGEIMDATLHCVANVDADDTNSPLRDALNSDHTALSLNGRDNSTHPPSNAETTSDNHTDSGRPSYDSQYSSHTSSIFYTLLRRQHHVVDEDPSVRLVNKRIFSKMIMEAGEHPFFKRVWMGRHVLDDSSPILRPKVRRQIRRNKGYWPERLNNYEAVRESLQFNQILVSLNGISNVSASDVYAQKIYDFVDINVGYQFVNILYKDANGALKVDTDLINDVREQKGGGGEPLILGES